MLVMRPAQMADLGEVQRLAADSPIGVTSLPDDVERLSDKIAASEASFAAERLCGLKSRTFLAELMPHYPIYVPLLPDEAQEAMGQVHPRAQITFDILMREGFETDHYIDIFDGGPTLHARVSGIRSIAQSRVVPVKIGEMAKGVGRQYLVSNAQLQDYRAVMLELDYAPGKPVTLDLAAAEALGVGEGASVRLVAV